MEYATFKDITTLRVGGPIKAYERFDSSHAFISFIKEKDKTNESLLIVGGGSNILAPDAGFSGTVVTPSFNSVVFEKHGDDYVLLIVDAGAVWDDVVRQSVEEGLWGLENLSSIPGTVGAAPMQNIGAYGADVSQTIEWVQVYDRVEKKLKKLTPAELSFGYRDSALKKERGRFAVLQVAFLLSRIPTPNVSYKDLKLRFGEVSSPVLGDIRDAVIEIRKGKFPDLSEYGSAGSFFMNPILTEEIAADFLKRFPEAPNFPAPEGVKLSLAWILDNIVAAKGMNVGGAFVWDKQPLVLATNTEATGDDVRALMHALQEKVFKATKIKITPEVFVMK